MTSFILLHALPKGWEFIPAYVEREYPKGMPVANSRSFGRAIGWDKNVVFLFKEYTSLMGLYSIFFLSNLHFQIDRSPFQKGGNLFPPM